MSKRNHHRYTEEQIEFVKKRYSKYTNHEIATEFNKKFGTNQKHTSFNYLGQKYGLKSNVRGKGARFVKGQNTYPDGKKRSSPHLVKYQYEKGRKSNRALPVGTETDTDTGFLLLKVAAPNTWEMKHRFLWEQEHGSIPEGSVIVFKDGNKRNFDLDNLMMTDHAVPLSVGRRGVRSENPEINEAVFRITELDIKTNRLERKSKK